MLITFYNCKSARNIIDKNITQVGSPLEIVWKEDNSVISPYIKLKGYVTGNYCQISDGGQAVGYYFVKSIDYIQGGVYGLQLELDPLYTYRTEIKAATIKVEKIQVLSNNVNPTYTRDNALLLIGG